MNDEIITTICFYDENGDIVRKQFTDEELKQFWPPDTNGEPE